jgi:hypothetical protein
MLLGTVSSLWRYPVKSLQGERLERAWLGRDGVPGDRGVALVDAETGKVLSGKRVEMLLTARAVARPGGPAIVMPDGRTAHTADPAAGEMLSAWLGRPVRLERAGVRDGRPAILGEEDGTFLGRPGGFFDSSAVHLLTTSTLAHLGALHPEGRFDERRFRPNVLIDGAGQGPVEQGWIGRRARAGDAVLEITKACSRCVMTTSEQADLPKDRDILRTVAREAGNETGVYARVLEPGWVGLGDTVEAIEGDTGGSSG